MGEPSGLPRWEISGACFHGFAQLTTRRQEVWTGGLAVTKAWGQKMPATYTFVAKVKLTNKQVQEVRIQADTMFNAKAMIESQYGKGSIFGGIRQLR